MRERAAQQLAIQEAELAHRQCRAATLIQCSARGLLARQLARRLGKGRGRATSYTKLKNLLTVHPHLQRSLYAAYASHERAWENSSSVAGWVQRAEKSDQTTPTRPRWLSMRAACRRMERQLRVESGSSREQLLSLLSDNEANRNQLLRQLAALDAADDDTLERCQGSTTNGTTALTGSVAMVGSSSTLSTVAATAAAAAEGAGGGRGAAERLTEPPMSPGDAVRHRVRSRGQQLLSIQRRSGWSPNALPAPVAATPAAAAATAAATAAAWPEYNKQLLSSQQ